MTKTARKNNKRYEEDSEDLALKNVVGGMSDEFSRNIDLLRLRVKCPVPGCNFECNEFTDMNVHMRMCHPEMC